MDEASPSGERSRRKLPARYSYQFTLRQTLFGEIVCAVDTKYNRRVAIKLSYKDKQVLSGGEDPHAEVKIFRQLSSSLKRDYSNGSVASATSVESKASDCDVDSPGRRLARLQRTAKIAAGENEDIEGEWHPNVIKFYYSGEDREKLFTVLEFAHRGELLDHITNSPQGKLSEIDAARIIAQVARGLQFCHDNGLAHLDVSPENILLTRKWEAKLCDFGLAKHMDAEGIVHRTHSTGKANYMAPEAYATKNNRRNSKRQEAFSGKFAGAPADVFSLGIVAFLCITGVLPYQHPLKSDRRFVFVTGGKEALASLLKRWGIQISRQAIDLLSRMLAVDPKKRATIQDVLESEWVSSVLGSPSPPTDTKKKFNSAKDDGDSREAG
eukprot:CAMPEP_0184489420 /NCGR_PEP_ID=MMETSP0113_2-20130426/15355_1 /TAXON_ID=91329 /ORGANISM="Norrisiella sphaerica, Strain BC52" /LENGTH=381 /DNA_ID=CAMNT_0026872827 /DNA_START=221 /DNA_END=1366 /DNA_ORIENTATION=-